MTKTEADVTRRQRLNAFLDAYLTSSDRVGIYREYESDLRKATPMDLFQLRLFSDDSRLSVTEIQKQAGRFVNLFFHGLSAYEWNRRVHPILERFLAEDKAIMDRLEAIKPRMESQVIRQSAREIRELYLSLAEVDKKFAKMQNILFPVLEKRLKTAMPFRVLWAVHDELSELRPRIVDLLSEEPLPWSEIIPMIGHYHYELAGLIQKDELILFPIASESLLIEDWEAMESPAEEVGFAFLSPRPWRQEGIPSQLSQNRIKTATGELTVAQFEMMMSALTVAVTYVDENDRVVYYNETKERHFPRTPQAIGREVRRCHPEKSLATVEKILAEFKGGHQNEAVFWMDFRGMKLLISYLAVRNAEGEYRGVLEVTQDITRMDEFQGEHRLLDWDRKKEQ